MVTNVVIKPITQIIYLFPKLQISQKKIRMCPQLGNIHVSRKTSNVKKSFQQSNRRPFKKMTKLTLIVMNFGKCVPLKLINTKIFRNTQINKNKIWSGS